MMSTPRKILFVALMTLSGVPLSAEPDTVTNRHASAEDAAFWPSVNPGDFLIFRGNADGGKAIYLAGSLPRITLEIGKKILIWRGSYSYISIDGSQCANTEEQPTIITNLGGQVKWGYNEDPESGWRRIELNHFDHVFLTGKHDPLAQTGDSNWLGHHGGVHMDQPDYYERYGMWGNPRWSGMRFRGSVGNIVRILNFKSAKLSYVAASEGGFAAFNIKTDSPSVPGRVKVDIQDCFAGWTEGEAVYLAWSTGAAGQDLVELTLRNNLFVFAGCETIQSDNLVKSSVIEHNVGFVGACFHRRPFQSEFQDGLHQFSFVEGGLVVRDNVLIGAGGMLHQFRFKNPGEGRAFPHPDFKVEMINNYYGYSRSNLCFVWEGDGITPYVIDGNVYGPIATPSTRDGYLDPVEFPYYFKVCNQTNEILLSNNLYPPGRELYGNDCGASMVTLRDNLQGVAPLVAFENSGFEDSTEYRDFSFWSPVYQTGDKNGQFIPYRVGEFVFYYDDQGNTRFFRCIQAHQGNHDPNLSPEYWAGIEWNGRRLPPLDLRLKAGSFYELRGMGLSYQAPDQRLKLDPVGNREVQAGTRLDLELGSSGGVDGALSFSAAGQASVPE
jgi:hypothetical protein